MSSDEANQAPADPAPAPTEGAPAAASGPAPVRPADALATADVMWRILAMVACSGGRLSRKPAFDAVFDSAVNPAARAAAEQALLDAFVEEKGLRLEGDELVLDSHGIEVLGGAAVEFENRLNEIVRRERKLDGHRETRAACPLCRRKVDNQATTELLVRTPGERAFRLYPLTKSVGCQQCRTRLGFPDRGYVVPVPESAMDGPSIAAALRSEATALERPVSARG